MATAQTVVEAVLSVHQHKTDEDAEEPDYCSECTWQDPNDSEPTGIPYWWPCPTVAAVAAAVGADPAAL